MTAFERRWQNFSAASEKAADKTDKTPKPQREEEVSSVLSVGFQDTETEITGTHASHTHSGAARALIKKTCSSFTEEDVQDLLRQAEAYITLYGPLCVRCGAKSYRNVVQPETLVELRLSHPHGTVADRRGELRTRWGRP